MIADGTVRFGILGTSRIAKRSVIPAIIASSEAELAMIGSRSIEQARECAQAFGCDSYGTYEDVLANPDIDAVYISLPNSLHEEWTIKAAQAGKHIWCEKPAALSYESAKRMVTAAKQNNVRLMEGFMFLHHPQHAKVLDIIKSGALGILQSFKGAFVFPRPEADNIRLSPELGGGILNDAGTYPIRASRHIFDDEPESFSATLVIDEKTGVDTQFDATLTFPENRIATIHAAFGDDYRSTYEVIGSEGTLSTERAYAVPADRGVKIFLERNGVAEEFTIDPADHFQLMLDEFCREIRLGTASTKPYEDDLLKQARILDAARKAHSGKKTVRLSEIN